MSEVPFTPASLPRHDTFARRHRNAWYALFVTLCFAPYGAAMVTVGAFITWLYMAATWGQSCRWDPLAKYTHPLLDYMCSYTKMYPIDVGGGCQRLAVYSDAINVARPQWVANGLDALRLLGEIAVAIAWCAPIVAAVILLVTFPLWWAALKKKAGVQ